MSATENFVRSRILAYPLIYSNRTEVLHHVFCVIGNGYKWSEDGTVVPTDERSPWDQEEQLIKIEEDLEAYEPFIQEILRPGMLASYLAELETVENVETLIHVRPSIENIYPQSDYALLMNVPENAKAEWKALADEARSLTYMPREWLPARNVR
jgi:hypothetical protein